jgi:hypothetical protein
MEREFKRRDNDQRSMLRAQQQALDIDTQRTMESSLRSPSFARSTTRQAQSLQRMNQQGLGKRLGRAASPDAKQEFEINQSRVIGEMEVCGRSWPPWARSPLTSTSMSSVSRAGEAAGHRRHRTRLGPFAGTLKQFSMAALALGPILVGLLGTVTASGGRYRRWPDRSLGMAGAAQRHSGSPSEASGSLTGFAVP